jgi:hypothetical protein
MDAGTVCRVLTAETDVGVTDWETQAEFGRDGHLDVIEEGAEVWGGKCLQPTSGFFPVADKDASLVLGGTRIGEDGGGELVQDGLVPVPLEDR